MVCTKDFKATGTYYRGWDTVFCRILSFYEKLNLTNTRASKSQREWWSSKFGCKELCKCTL